MRTKQFEIALSTFEKLRAAFPALSMEFDLQPAHVDLAVDIPAQAGLSFPVFLNLQNLDELCLEASALGVSWFPCTNPQKVAAPTRIELGSEITAGGSPTAVTCANF